MSEPDLTPPAELVAGKYRLTRLLGRGGMGAVWEGVHATLGTHVAVKFIEKEYANSQEAIQRFENEARAAARLRSKHVVSVHDHGVMEDGRPYIVMEFLAGEPLDQRLARVGRLDLRETAQIVIHVCRALARAHEVGIVHRDLKPENVFLVRDEEDGTEIAKVVDFGIAKFTDKSSGLSSSTKTGAVLGTPYFMSPEQARGLRSVDYRSDLWSMGVIAYRCIVGQMPFTGEAVGDLLVQICTAPLPVPSQLAPGVPPGFDAWTARALAREPAERFQSAQELSDAMAALAGLPVVSPGRAAGLDSGPGFTIPAGTPPLAAGGITAAPFTQSTAFAPKRRPLGLIIGGALLASVMLLVFAGLIVSRAFSGAAAAASSEVTAVGSGSIEAVEPVATPSVASSVEAPSASSEPAAVMAPAPSAEPSAQPTPKPVIKTVTAPVGKTTSGKTTSGKTTSGKPKDELGY